MKIAFVGAGACFANVAEDILAKCERKRERDLKWKILHGALQRHGPGARYEVHYMDCGPELARAEKKGDMFTYSIAKGGLLSGAGNIGTGEKFFRDAQWNVQSKLQSNMSRQKVNLFLSIRGAGATNCGAGFLLDRELLKTNEHSVMLQFVILPYRGEGIEASRVVFLARQLLEMLEDFPDRYAPILMSNEQIMAGAKSFQQAGMNWFYPLANTTVADVIVRILYPTLYHTSEESTSGAEGGFEIDSRQKYLDLRDFIRQPGLRAAAFSHLDDDVPLSEEAVARLTEGALGPLSVGKVPDSDDLAVTGNFAPMSNPLTAFSMLTGPKGQVGDMTKMSLSAVLEDKLPGCFPRCYTYDITPGRYEMLLFPGGGVPDDLAAWIRKFGKNLRNPRYKDLVNQSTYPFEKVVGFYEKVAEHFAVKPE
ncbi:MAG: hypothetical protein ACYTAF_09085 [Planctomycetota bacterium]|jgi:hypothetical protein